MKCKLTDVACRFEISRPIKQIRVVVLFEPIRECFVESTQRLSFHDLAKRQRQRNVVLNMIVNRALLLTSSNNEKEIDCTFLKT